MTDKNMKMLSLAEIRAMKNSGQLYQDPNAPEVELSDEFWAQAKLVERPVKKPVHLRLDPDVYRFFHETAQGKGHIKKMQDVLTAYALAHKSV